MSILRFFAQILALNFAMGSLSLTFMEMDENGIMKPQDFTIELPNTNLTLAEIALRITKGDIVIFEQTLSKISESTNFDIDNEKLIIGENDLTVSFVAVNTGEVIENSQILVTSYLQPKNIFKTESSKDIIKNTILSWNILKLSVITVLGYLCKLFLTRTPKSVDFNSNIEEFYSFPPPSFPPASPPPYTSPTLLLPKQESFSSSSTSTSEQALAPSSYTLQSTSLRKIGAFLISLGLMSTAYLSTSNRRISTVMTNSSASRFASASSSRPYDNGLSTNPSIYEQYEEDNSNPNSPDKYMHIDYIPTNGVWGGDAGDSREKKRIGLNGMIRQRRDGPYSVYQGLSRISRSKVEGLGSTQSCRFSLSRKYFKNK